MEVLVEEMVMVVKEAVVTELLKVVGMLVG